MKVEKEILLQKYFPEALAKVKELIQIPSFRTTEAKGLPVPADIKRCLEYTVNLCKSFGWKTFIAPDHQYGYADWGTGEKLFGILCHLDVVPPGDMTKWFTDPFTPIEKDGKLIGRGAYDDKGPTMMNLYAAKYLMDNGFEPDFTVRFIFGTAEETTWEGMEAYIARERHVDLGYVPDANFPVVYAEKYIEDGDLTGAFVSPFTLKGGEVYNAVCDLATYCGPKSDEITTYLQQNNIDVTRVADDTLEIRGQSAHGSFPEKGVNAITWALAAINEVGIYHPLAKFAAEYLHNNCQMAEIFGDLSDETGMLTACIGRLDLTKTQYTMTFNFRVPCTRDPKKDVAVPFAKFVEKVGMKYTVVGIEDKVYFEKTSDVVTWIMKVYQEVTGDMKAQPLAIGGGTYAKAMPNLIAFGAEFDQENTSMHTNNESVRIEELQKMLEIYAKSLVILTGKK